VKEVPVGNAGKDILGHKEGKFVFELLLVGDILDFNLDQIGSTNAGQGYKCTLIVVRAN